MACGVTWTSYQVARLPKSKFEYSRYFANGINVATRGSYRNRASETINDVPAVSTGSESDHSRKSRQAAWASAQTHLLLRDEHCRQNDDRISPCESGRPGVLAVALS